jgi:hypothetical protein
MGFESPNQPTPPEENIEQSNESKPSIFERARKFGRLAALFGVLSSYPVYEIGKRVKHDVDYNNYIENTSPEYKSEYKTMKEELVALVGEDAVTFMEEKDKQAFFERQEKPSAELEVKGFEELGLDSQVLKQIWNEENGVYPKGWIRGEISSIEYSSKDLKQVIPGADNKYGKELSKASPAGSYSPGSITFYPSLQTTLAKYRKLQDKNEKEIISSADVGKYFDSTFSHEIGHANDWFEDKDMDRHARAQLLLKVIKRLRSDNPAKEAGSFVSGSKGYVNEIENPNPLIEIELKSREYWGEIVQNYFQYPSWTAKTFPEDYKIVDELVKKTDPNFDPIKSAIQRETALEKLK